VLCSLCSAGLFYSLWLASFLQFVRPGSTTAPAALWLSAPVVTAAGFATGITIHERLTQQSRHPFLRILVWPLIGCAAGAGAVFWLGPMLIVFAMFGAGTAAVVLREVVLHLARDQRGQRPP
jgi:hypothetical protein